MELAVFLWVMAMRSLRSQRLMSSSWVTFFFTFRWNWRVCMKLVFSLIADEKSFRS